MSHRYLTTLAVTAALLIGGTGADAIDYSGHSAEQLEMVRDADLFLDDADRSDFTAEWHRRFGTDPWAEPVAADPSEPQAVDRPVSWNVAVALGHYGYGHHRHGHGHRNFHRDGPHWQPYRHRHYGYRHHRRPHGYWDRGYGIHGGHKRRN
jgi:hypothetical protein